MRVGMIIVWGSIGMIKGIWGIVLNFYWGICFYNEKCVENMGFKS